jgi:hypothetical protein
MDCVVFGPAVYGAQFYVSEVAVATEDISAFRVKTQFTSASGDIDEWTGAYTDVNPVTINDSNSVYTNVVAKKELFNLNDLPAGVWTVRGCLLAARSVKTAGSSVGTEKLGWKTNSTEDVDAGHTLTTAQDCYERFAAQNPVTAADWQMSEINALQAMLESDT